MVRFKNLKCKGLYSIFDEQDLDFSDRNIVVGHNDSGKSNLFRIMKMFVDTFFERKRLDIHKVSFGHNNPQLEISLEFSKEETEKIIDFFSFYHTDNNNSSEYHEFKNRELLVGFLNDMQITLSWKQEFGDSSITPDIKIKFPKLGLCFFSYDSNGFRISNRFPQKYDETQFNKDKLLTDLLDLIDDKIDPKESINTFFKEIQADIGASSIKPHMNKMLSDKAQKILNETYSFLEIDWTQGRETHFDQFLGRIFKKSIHFSAGNRGIRMQSIHDYVNLMDSGYQDPNLEHKTNFNDKLASKIFAKILKISTELDDDGNNLPSYLFSLKNSLSYNDRNKFSNIQKMFASIFESDKIIFDVILEYKKEIIHDDHVGNHTKFTPMQPTIMIFNKQIQRQTPINHVGTGISETLYLLAITYGYQDSLVLLDEPSANLHPILMKSLTKKLHNTDNQNQFIIITHSPELAGYEIFEEKATIFYFRKKDSFTLIKKLDGETKDWFDKDRRRLRHQIDSRIFFSKVSVLVEGDSDLNLLLGVKNYFEDTDKKFDATGNNIVIISAGGKKSLRKNIDLMKSFGMLYVVLADSDASDLFKDGYGAIDKDHVEIRNSIVVIKNGNLETLMKDIDSECYLEAEKENKKSKPAIAHSFIQKVSSNQPEKLGSLKQLLQEIIKISQQQNTSRTK